MIKIVHSDIRCWWDWEYQPTGRWFSFVAGGVACLFGLLFMSCTDAKTPVQSAVIDTNYMQEMNDKINDTLEMATFGAGCFWCVEAVFQRLNGVVSVQSGYSGGTVKNPSYKEVCTGNTGHAEVVQITYNPQQISYSQLLEVLFATHDPTTLNRQGGDVGTQYRSVIFYHNDDQKRLAELAIKAANESGVWENPIVTEVSPLVNFYPAEDYHNNYFNLNADANPYCQLVIVPKVEKFKRRFAELLK